MRTDEVLKNIEKYIELDEWVRITDVYPELGIFDWWKDYVTQNDLKTMKSFLETAESIGYNGYCCFKVGASGCANGMWAYPIDSETGYSPKGAFLYRSFTPDYTDWNMYDGKDFLSNNRLTKRQMLKLAKEKGWI